MAWASRRCRRPNRVVTILKFGNRIGMSFPSQPSKHCVRVWSRFREEHSHHAKHGWWAPKRRRKLRGWPRKVPVEAWVPPTPATPLGAPPLACKACLPQSRLYRLIQVSQRAWAWRWAPLQVAACEGVPPRLESRQSELWALGYHASLAPCHPPNSWAPYARNFDRRLQLPRLGRRRGGLALQSSHQATPWPPLCTHMPPCTTHLAPQKFEPGAQTCT